MNKTLLEWVLVIMKALAPVKFDLPIGNDGGYLTITIDFTKK